MSGIRSARALAFAILILALSSGAVATTPPPGFGLQETLSVPSKPAGAFVTSATILRSGVTYKIRASGTISRADTGSCRLGDAEYGHLDPANPDCTPATSDPLTGIDLGIGINDTALDGSKFPNWGAFTATHEYTIDFAGLGATIKLNYHDCPACYGDNNGSLTVEIFAPAQTVAFSLVVDTDTPIPGGTGHFTSFWSSDFPQWPPSPNISGGNVVFFGAGSSGQKGIYTQWPPQPIKVVADTNTPIPGGTGNLQAWPPGPNISGQNILFVGFGSGGQQGLYALYAPAALSVLADQNTPIPGGTGNFIQFWSDDFPATPPSPSKSVKNVVFYGQGTSGQKGIYTKWPPSPYKVVADTNTPIPGGTGNLQRWPPVPTISGENIAFIGLGSASQAGIYLTVGGGALTKVVNTADAVPGGSGPFQHFDQVTLEGTSLAFAGGNSSGGGVYTAIGGALAKVADTNTSIPGGTGAFTGFGNVSMDPVNVVFEGFGGGGQKGIYAYVGGVLMKVVDLTDTLWSKTLTDVNFGRGGFSGQDVFFEADFTDGSAAIVKATVGVPAAGVFIGLANSDDVGLRLDLHADVGVIFPNGGGAAIVASGDLASVSAGGSGFSKALFDAIPLTELFPFSLSSGTEIDFILKARNACAGSGKASGRARLYYDDPAGNSSFTLPEMGTLFLRKNFLLDASPGPAPPDTKDVSVGAKCGPYVSFGTWSIVLP